MFQAFKNTIRRYDIWMLLFAAAATAIGIFFIYSSTKTLDNNLKYIVVQVAAICIGLVLMYVLTVISYEDLAECWKFSDRYFGLFAGTGADYWDWRGINRHKGLDPRRRRWLAAGGACKDLLYFHTCKASGRYRRRCELY